MRHVARLLGVSDSGFLRSTDVRLIFVISMVSSTGAIASPALPAMSASLGVSGTRIGLVFTAFTLPAILALPFVGTVADLYGRKVVIVPGLLLFGCAGVAVGLVADFSWILILRGIQGVGYTAFNSVAVALLGDVLSGTEESAAQGTRVLLNKTTGFVGPAVAGVLAAIAWQYPFYLYAVAIPTGILSFVYLQSESDEAATEGEKTANADQLGNMRRYASEIRPLFTDPLIASILAGGFFRLFMKYALLTFLPLVIVTQHRGSLGYAGFLVGTYSLVGAVVASQSARFTATLSHAYALVLGFAIAAVALVVIPLADGLAALSLLTVVHGVGEGIINPVHKSIMTQSVARNVRAGLVTLNAMVQNVAKTIAPIVIVPLVLFVDEPAYDILFAGIGSVTLGVTIIAYLFLRTGRLVPRDVGAVND